MAGYIRKRGTRTDGSTKWQARYWDKDDPTVRYERVFRTKTEAQAWLTTQANAQLTGTHIDPRRADKPFREVAQVWRETWVDIEPKTRVGYEAILRANLLPEFGSRKVSTITPALVQSYIARLQKEGAAAGTIRNIYAVLRNALNTAVRLKVITVNPCAGVKLPRMPREAMLFLSAAEVAELAAEVARPVDKEGEPTTPRPEYAVLVYTAAYTGLRAGELLALTRADVDLLHGKLFVRRALKELNGSGLGVGERGLQFGPTKNHTSRTVGLPKFLVEMLREHLAGPLPSGTAPDALVFPSATGLAMRHNLWYRRHFKPAVKRALPERLHGLRFHDLRHTAASLLIAAGAHPKAIQERLGHSTIQITMDRYGHLLPSTDLALTEALDATHAAVNAPASVATLAR